MEQGPFCRRAGQHGGSAHFGGHTPAIVEFAAVGSSCETGGTVWATLENTGDTRNEEAEIELWYQGLDTAEAEMLVDSQVLFPLEPGDATTVLLSTSQDPAAMRSRYGRRTLPIPVRFALRTSTSTSASAKHRHRRIHPRGVLRRADLGGGFSGTAVGDTELLT